MTITQHGATPAPACRRHKTFHTIAASSLSHALNRSRRRWPHHRHRQPLEPSRAPATGVMCWRFSQIGVAMTTFIPRAIERLRNVARQRVACLD